MSKKQKLETKEDLMAGCVLLFLILGWIIAYIQVTFILHLYKNGYLTFI